MSHKIIIRREKRKLGHPFTGLLIRKAVTMALRAEQIPECCMVNVLLTDGDGIRDVNRQFRDTDRETDVLSFPFNECVPGAFQAEACERDPQSGMILLGDMMISVPRCEEQGKEFGHGYRREVMYLSVHSVLHLLGYDHVDEGRMKEKMRAREKMIMGDQK